MSHDSRAVPIGRLWVAVFAGYLALGATLQLLPTWVTDHLHYGATAAGAAVGLAFVATALTRPYAGAGADRGRPQRLVVLGGILVTVGAVVSALATHLALLLLGRVVMGAGEALLFGAAIPWVLSVYPPAQRGRVSGLFGLSMWGGLALGPVAASVVRSTRDAAAVWWFVVIVGAVSAVFALAAARAPSMLPRRAEPLSLRHLVPRSALLPGLVFGCAGYAYGCVSAALVLSMNHQHLASAAGLPVFAAAFLGVRIVGAGLVDRFGGPSIAVVSLLVAATGAGTVIVATSTPTALVGAGLLGVGTSQMFPATVSWALARGGAAAVVGPGTSIGTSTSFWDLGICCGGIATGVLITHGGYPAAWGTATGLLLAAAALAATQVRRGQRTSLS